MSKLFVEVREADGAHYNGAVVDIDSSGAYVHTDLKPIVQKYPFEDLRFPPENLESCFVDFLLDVSRNVELFSCPGGHGVNGWWKVAVLSKNEDGMYTVEYADPGFKCIEVCARAQLRPLNLNLSLVSQSLHKFIIPVPEDLREICQRRTSELAEFRDRIRAGFCCYNEGMKSIIVISRYPRTKKLVRDSKDKQFELLRKKRYVIQVQVAKELIGLVLGRKGFGIREARSVPGISSVDLIDEAGVFEIAGESFESVNIARDFVEYIECIVYIPIKIFDWILNKARIQQITKQTGLCRLNTNLSTKERSLVTEHNPTSRPIVLIGNPNSVQLAKRLLLQDIEIWQNTSKSHFKCNFFKTRSSISRLSLNDLVSESEKASCQMATLPLERNVRMSEPDVKWSVYCQSGASFNGYYKQPDFHYSEPDANWVHLPQNEPVNATLNQPMLYEADQPLSFYPLNRSTYQPLTMSWDVNQQMDLWNTNQMYPYEVNPFKEHPIPPGLYHQNLEEFNVPVPPTPPVRLTNVNINVNNYEPYGVTCANVVSTPTFNFNSNNQKPEAFESINTQADVCEPIDLSRQYLIIGASNADQSDENIETNQKENEVSTKICVVVSSRLLSKIPEMVPQNNEGIVKQISENYQPRFQSKIICDLRFLNSNVGYNIVHLNRPEKISFNCFMALDPQTLAVKKPKEYKDLNNKCLQMVSQNHRSPRVCWSNLYKKSEGVRVCISPDILAATFSVGFGCVEHEYAMRCEVFWFVDGSNSLQLSQSLIQFLAGLGSAGETSGAVNRFIESSNSNNIDYPGRRTSSGLEDSKMLSCLRATAIDLSPGISNVHINASSKSNRREFERIFLHISKNVQFYCPPPSSSIACSNSKIIKTYSVCDNLTKTPSKPTWKCHFDKVTLKPLRSRIASGGGVGVFHDSLYCQSMLCDRIGLLTQMSAAYHQIPLAPKQFIQNYRLFAKSSIEDEIEDFGSTEKQRLEAVNSKKKSQKTSAVLLTCFEYVSRLVVYLVRRFFS